ncbi:MAG TPA: DUF3344 domain-containing protein [Methanoregulaceae archaeon]|nr:MAG: DUF3344 domain-containing protein [Methanolinea sp.]HON82236.1 DUF3344 domain-containing protein [Methanoregulaceae archaeon]HPD10991.1 DUF3344 domain-containing protein [Methanoregulaceae archaeon]HRT15202.1 DUF3344 domain-containing protein [Methanoregulaceae archaeon]HRU30681.1 DUF3344 domain-containing protein [Methanoregulaceae archaeon]
MHFPDVLLSGVVIAFVLLIPPGAATYAGDNTLRPAFLETVVGGYSFVLGNGTYSGILEPGSAYESTLLPEVPAGSSPLYHRIYVYWSWSKRGQAAIFPGIGVQSVPERPGSAPVFRDRFIDNKGFASQNDFYSGMDTYEFPAGTDLRVPFTIRILNTGSEGETFTIQGIGFLAVYTIPGGRERVIQVMEGADLLYSRYGITPEMATSRVEFPLPLAIDRVEDAELFLVAPSGGYSLTGVPEMNRLFFNRGDEGAVPLVLRPVVHILFPSFSGKTWTDIFTATELQQIGIDRREVKPFLRAGGNRAEVQDNGDYLQLTNAVLEVTYGGR